MKKYLILLALATLCFTTDAQQNRPRPSPAGSVSTTVGFTDIKIAYSRPQVKGRKIFGAGDDYLLPYGKLWRTGANDGTKISFSTDVTVEGHAVPKGEYLIYTIPGADEWTVTLYTDMGLGGEYDKYDKSKELVRFAVKPRKLADPVDTLTINIADISADSKRANVQIAWENTSVKFGVEVPL